MIEAVERKVAFQWHEPRSHYDVVIIGGGGHGLATAYYLATRHGITDVAVLERGYIGSGNSGRNTTIIRANYGIPEAVRFYQRSVDLYQGLEEETDRDLMHSQKGLLLSFLLRPQIGESRILPMLIEFVGELLKIFEPLERRLLQGLQCLKLGSEFHCGARLGQILCKLFFCSSDDRLKIAHPAVVLKD